MTRLLLDGFESILIFRLEFIILTACSGAKQASEVNKVYVSSSKYKSFTCKELVNESEIIRSREPALAAKVDKHYKSQKNTEAVTWLLFWPAAFWLDDGAADSNELAQVRGELDAIRQAMLSKDC